MTQPNTPNILVEEGATSTNPDDFFLAEFSDEPGLKEILIADGESETSSAPIAAACGVRLRRVLAKVDQSFVEYGYDSETDAVSLKFMQERTTAILASARPGKPYVWQLIEVARPDGDQPYLIVIGARLAAAEEIAILEDRFPGWLAACEQFDAAGCGIGCDTSSSVILPPPVAHPLIS
jgi:hypothetical protein